MANKYEIPFGVNAQDFFDGLNQIEKGVDKLQSSVTEATNDMEKGFNEAGTAADKLGSKLEQDAKKAALLKDEAKSLGKEIGAALSGKNLGADFEKRVESFNKILNQFSNNANKPIKFNLDAAKLEHFENLLKSGVSELEVLTQATAAASEQLSNMDPNTEEFQKLAQQISITEAFLEEYNKAMAAGEQEQKDFAKRMADTGLSFEQVYGELQPLQTRLGEIEDRMYEMALAGDTSSESFKALQSEAIRMRQTIQQVDAGVDTFAKNSAKIDIVVEAVQGIVGVFTAAQGAIALFGEENEDAQEVIQKVTGALAVLQGLQAAVNVLNKDSALGALLASKARTTLTTATVAGAAAETADAAATTADTAAKTANATATAGATSATRAFTLALLANPITAVVAGLAALTAAIIYFSSETEDAEEVLERFNRALERSNLLMSLNEASINRRTALQVARAKAAGAAESEITTIEGKALAERVNLAKEHFELQREIYNDMEGRKKLNAEENKKIEDDYISSEQKYLDLENELQVKRIQRTDQRNKEGIEAAKKAQEEAKKAAEQRRAILEQELKFTNETAKQIVDAMPDSFAKSKAAAELTANQRIAELEREKILSEKAEEDRAALIAEIRKTLAAQLAQIDEDFARERYATQLKANAMRADLMSAGQAQELEILRADYNIRVSEIEDQFKNEIQLRDQLLDQLNKAYLRKREVVQADFNRQNNELAEKSALLEVETASKYLRDLPGVEEQKQLAILQVKLKYAEINLKAMEKLGGDENKQAIEDLKLFIAQLNKEIVGAQNNLKDATAGFDMFELFGLGDLDKRQRNAVEDAVGKSLESVKGLTDFIIDQYQRQIDKKQEVIDKYDEDIETLQDRIDQEKDLMDQGYANNVEALEAELAAKKQAKDEEIRQQEEMQRKQTAIARAQAAVDTGVQASNLITAATKIFSSLAGIPFVGIPLAIATIGLMTGAFVAAKVKTFQMINDQKQSFGGGGWIDGESHSRGGQKYVSADGRGGVVELEGGEHVTNKKQASKYSNLLEAINNDDLSRMHEDALAEMLHGLGIHMSNEHPKEAIKVIHENEGLKQAILVQSGPNYSDVLESVDSGIKQLVKSDQDTPKHWEDEMFYYVKVGNKTTKFRKK